MLCVYTVNVLVTSDPLQVLQKDLRLVLQQLQSRNYSLRFEEAHRETILESIDDGIIVTDAHLSVRYANRRLWGMLQTHPLGWDGQHISVFHDYIKQNSNDLGAPGFDDIYTAVIGDAALPPKDCEVEWIKSGSRYVRIYTGPIYSLRSEGKECLGRVWKLEDITHHRELEQARSEILSLATHQLRTPLTAMWGYLKMIEGGDYGELPAELQRALGVVASSTEKMRQLINELLDISHVESGTRQLTKENFDLVASVGRVIAEVEPIIRDKNLEVKLVSVLPEIMVNADQLLIEEMMKNLLTNAIKYSYEGKRIVVGISFSDGDHLALSVHDQGIGIPKSQQVRLFEKFFRADNARKLPIEGTGLGLYFVKKCAQLMNASIGFKSIEKVGSEFWVKFPIENLLINHN